MSDFRIPLPRPHHIGFEQELDWNEQRGVWTVSEREIGSGTRWFLDVTASSRQLSYLLRFFRVRPSALPPERLVTSSPYRLAEHHQALVTRPSVYAVACPACAGHCLAFRFDGKSRKWTVWGRTCDFQWARGRDITRDELALLNSTQQTAAGPCRKCA